MRWFLLLLVLYASQGFSETSLWRVSKGANTLFIGGTIHVLRKSDYPLPSAFDNAFAQASKIIFETDIATTEDPAFGQQMMQQMMYSDGRTLQDGLSKKTYQLLEEFCTAHGLPIIMFQQMRPSVAVLSLMMLELKRLGISDAGVDSHYFQRALTEKKTIGELETATEQLDFLAELGKGREDDFVRYSLKDMQQLETGMRELTVAWREGDLKKMAVLSLDDMREEFPVIYQQLLVDRNKKWLPRIESMLKDSDVELVLVGALHLAGKEGVLELLRERGYQLEQL